MYFYFDVAYGKNFEKTDSGVICSAAADFGIKKAFSILKQKYGPVCKISLDFGDDEDSLYFGDDEEDEDNDAIEFEVEVEFEDKDNDKNDMIIPEVELINKISKYRDWTDNELISNYWIRKWETKRELKI